MYWGKIVGTLVGLAMRNPWAAAAGFFFGHQFDRGFAARFKVFERQGANVSQVSEEFVEALMRLLQHEERRRFVGTSIGIVGKGHSCHLGDDGSLMIPWDWK